MLRIQLDNVLQRLISKRSVCPNTTMVERTIALLVSNDARQFRTAMMLSCRSVGKLCGVEAYLMAMLLPCTSYYDLNHGTVRNSSRRSFATTWNRISSCSVHLGNLCNDVISYRATASYEEVTDVYDGMSTLHTSRHNVYRVEARRDMVDMMHGEELGETMPDMFTNESISTYDVISSHGLHTCMEHALQYNYDCTCNYRNGH